MADDIDRAFRKAKDGDRLNRNEEHALRKLDSEGSQRGRDYKAWKSGNSK